MSSAAEFYETDLARRAAISEPSLPLEMRAPGMEDYPDILRLYLNSDWGRHHASQAPRYHLVYGYAPDQMVADLGLSIDPVYHGADAHADLQAFMMLQTCMTNEGLDMTPQEIAGARFGALTHDLGENTHPDFNRLFGRVIGDKERGTKTAEDQEAETRILIKIHDILFGMVPDETREYGRQLVRRQPELAGSQAAMLWAVSHEWGEYRTTTRAGELAVAMMQAGETSSLRFERLRQIGTECVRAVREELERQADDFLIVRRLLDHTNVRYRSLQASL